MGYQKVAVKDVSHIIRINKERGKKRRVLQLANYRVRLNGCWEWLGNKDKDGYGKVKRFGKTVRAHRLFYEEFIGELFALELVCHKCDNPSCVNPNHLFKGNQFDNEIDKDMKGRRRGNNKLVAKDIAYIRWSRRSSYFLSRVLKVCPTAIQAVRRGRTHRHI